MTTRRSDKSTYLTVEQYKALKRGSASSKANDKMTETDILKAIRDFLRLNGWMVIRNHQSLGSQRGIPDLTAIRGGQVVWIEVKTPSGRLSEHQERFLAELEDHGGWYIVARGVEDVEHLASGGGRNG